MALKKIDLWPVIALMTNEASLGHLIKIWALGDWAIFMITAAILSHIFLPCANCLHVTSCHHLSPPPSLPFGCLEQHSQNEVAVFHHHLPGVVSSWPIFIFFILSLFCWARQWWWWWWLVVIMHAWPIAGDRLRLLQRDSPARSLVARKAKASPKEGRWDKESSQLEVVVVREEVTAAFSSQPCYSGWPKGRDDGETGGGGGSWSKGSSHRAGEKYDVLYISTSSITISKSKKVGTQHIYFYSFFEPFSSFFITVYLLTWYSYGKSGLLSWFCGQPMFYQSHCKIWKE